MNKHAHKVMTRSCKLEQFSAAMCRMIQVQLYLQLSRLRAAQFHSRWITTFTTAVSMMAEMSDVSMETGSGSSASNRQVREADGYRWCELYTHNCIVENELNLGLGLPRGLEYTWVVVKYWSNRIVLEYWKLSVSGYYFHFRSSSPVISVFCEVGNGHLCCSLSLTLWTCRLQLL